MRHVEKVEIKKLGMLEDKDKRHEDEWSTGRDVIEKTARYYAKMRKNIATAIVPQFEQSKDGGLRIKNQQSCSFKPEINEKSK